MIVVTVFLSILNQMEFHLVQNRKDNCQHDHIPFNVIIPFNEMDYQFSQRTHREQDC